MNEEGKNILTLMTQIRTLCKGISALLQTADSLVEKDGWSTITKNTATSGNSYHIDFPEYWVPELYYRYYQHENYTNILLYVAVILDNRNNESVYTPEGKGKFEEPILTAGYFNHGNETEAKSFWKNVSFLDNKGNYCKGHFFSDDSSYDGKIWDLTLENMECFVKKTESRDEGLVKCKLKSLALPLIDIKDTPKIEESVIKPLFTNMKNP